MIRFNDLVLSEAGLKQVTCIVRERQLRLWASTGFMVASGGVLSGGYEHAWSGDYLGDGQTEAEGLPSQGGRGDALLLCMPLLI